MNRLPILSGFHFASGEIGVNYMILEVLGSMTCTLEKLCKWIPCDGMSNCYTCCAEAGAKTATSLVSGWSSGQVPKLPMLYPMALLHPVSGQLSGPRYYSNPWLVIPGISSTEGLHPYFCYRAPLSHICSFYWHILPKECISMTSSILQFATSKFIFES